MPPHMGGIFRHGGILSAKLFLFGGGNSAGPSARIALIKRYGDIGFGRLRSYRGEAELQKRLRRYSASDKWGRILRVLGMRVPRWFVTRDFLIRNCRQIG